MLAFFDLGVTRLNIGVLLQKLRWLRRQLKAIRSTANRGLPPLNLVGSRRVSRAGDIMVHIIRIPGQNLSRQLG